MIAKSKTDHELGFTVLERVVLKILDDEEDDEGFTDSRILEELSKLGFKMQTESSVQAVMFSLQIKGRVWLYCEDPTAWRNVADNEN